MIASWRGLAIAIGVALALAIAVIVGGGPAATLVEHAIAPGFAADAVTGLRWRGGGPELTVRRRPGAAIADDGAWQLVTDGRTIPADTNTVRDALAALRGGRWQRAAGAIASRRGLVVDGATPHVIGLGDPLPGGAQAWISVDGRGLLVDAWIARALDPSPLALRVKAPLADAAQAKDVTITDATTTLHLEPGPPARIVAASGARFETEPTRAAALAHALADVTIVRIPDSARAPAHGVTITIAGRSLTLGGPCAGAPALIATSGAWGEGCVEAAAAQAVDAALAWFHQPALALVATGLVQAAPRAITLLDGTRLDVTTGKVGDAPGKAALIRTLVSMLLIDPHTHAVPRPTAPPTGKVTVEAMAGPPLTLWLYPPRLAARDDEPFALPVADELWRLLHAGARTFRDLTPWLEEPTAVTAIQIDAVRFVRGDVIGAWRRAPGGPVAPPDAERLEALAKDLAQPNVRGEAEAPVAAAHTIAFTVAPPVGAPTTHQLVIGTPHDHDCPVQIGRDRLELPAGLCARVTALTR